MVSPSHLGLDVMIACCRQQWVRWDSRSLLCYQPIKWPSICLACFPESHPARSPTVIIARQKGRVIIWLGVKRGGVEHDGTSSSVFCVVLGRCCYTVCLRLHFPPSITASSLMGSYKYSMPVMSLITLLKQPSNLHLVCPKVCRVSGLVLIVLSLDVDVPV